MGSLPEATLRVQLVQTARRAARDGLIVASLGNLSVRHPTRADRLLITPSGVPYERLSGSDIVTMDAHGTVHFAMNDRRPSSEWRVHAAIFQTRPDVDAIVHTHGIHAQAFSFLGQPLCARTEELAIFVGGDVPIAEYAPSGTQELADHAARALGDDRQAVLLAQHGLASVGASLGDAYAVTQVVERQAHLAWLLRTAGGKRR